MPLAYSLCAKNWRNRSSGSFVGWSSWPKLFLTVGTTEQAVKVYIWVSRRVSGSMQRVLNRTCAPNKMAFRDLAAVRGTVKRADGYAHFFLQNDCEQDGKREK